MIEARDYGYHCRAAGTAEEALEVLRSGTAVDLLVTDVVMPGMSGGALGQHLDRIRPGLPILFISGYAGEDVIGRGLLTAGRPFDAEMNNDRFR